MCWISRGRVKGRVTQQIVSYFARQFAQSLVGIFAKRRSAWSRVLAPALWSKPGTANHFHSWQVWWQAIAALRQTGKMAASPTEMQEPSRTCGLGQIKQSLVVV